MNPKAICFDFDGVLADSEDLHFELFAEVLKPLGFSLDRAEYFRDFIGYDDQEFFKVYFKKYDPNHQKSSSEKQIDLIEQKDRLFLQAIQRRDYLFPGVRDLIPELAKQWPLCIVSGALKNEIQALLKPNQLEPFFHFIIAPGDYKQGKPSPEPYLLALQTFRNRNICSPTPEQCLVIEDTSYGIQAGQRAGMKTLGVLQTSDRDSLKMADFMIKSIAECTPEKIRSL